MQGVEVASGKDVRRGEGCAFYAVEEEDLVLGREEDYAFLMSDLCEISMGNVRKHTLRWGEAPRAAWKAWKTWLAVEYLTRQSV